MTKDNFLTLVLSYLILQAPLDLPDLEVKPETPVHQDLLENLVPLDLLDLQDLVEKQVLLDSQDQPVHEVKLGLPDHQVHGVIQDLLVQQDLLVHQGRPLSGESQDPQVLQGPRVRLDLQDLPETEENLELVEREANLDLQVREHDFNSCRA